MARSLLTAAAALLMLCACSPKVDNGGYISEGSAKDLLTIGQSTREDVRTRLGSPSSQSSFGDESWYYITARKEAYAFLKPEIVQQDVERVTFDGAGVVSNIEQYSIANAKDIEIVDRATRTEGHTLGFFEQILGNIGRFNGPGKGTGIAPGRKQN